MKIMVMDIKDVKNSVESHDIAVTEPIIASRILLNMIAVFSHDENLDEKTKEIFNDEKLFFEIFWLYLYDFIDNFTFKGF